MVRPLHITQSGGAYLAHGKLFVNTGQIAYDQLFGLTDKVERFAPAAAPRD